MSSPDQNEDDAGTNGYDERSLADRTKETFDLGARWTSDASTRHVSIAVPFRTARRTRRVAASVLAGGVAYRIFLWLLPFGLILGGALGLGDADSVENAASAGGIPAGAVDVIGDVARASDADWWWLLALGVPLLLWAGYTGATTILLVHALVWDEPPPRLEPLRGSLVFTGVCCAFMIVVALGWYVAEVPRVVGLAVLALATVPLAGIWLWVSLRLPHGTARRADLLPGAFLIAVGFQLLHATVVYLLVPKLESSTSLYGELGAIATILFFMYLGARLLVTAPILNSSLHAELRERGRGQREPAVP